MKTIIVTIVILIFYTPVLAQKKLIDAELDGQLRSNRIYKYDKNGRLKQEDNYSFGRLNDITAYKYDENGNAIERAYTLTAIEGKDVTSIYNFSDYEIDTIGNWTKRIEKFSEKVKDKTNLWKRVYYQKIVYYEN